MKKKNNEGFSLVECLVAIAVLALIVVPCCSGIVMAFRMNAKADQLMQAQLAVSSAVETLMAEGIPYDTAETQDGKDYGKTSDEYDRFPEVRILVVPKGAYTVDEKTYYTYYEVEVSSDLDADVEVCTTIRAVTPEEVADEET